MACIVNYSCFESPFDVNDPKLTERTPRVDKSFIVSNRLKENVTTDYDLDKLFSTVIHTSLIC